MAKSSAFRNWVQDLWLRYKDEKFIFGEQPLNSIEEYWNKYKYFIKRQYQLEQKRYAEKDRIY